MGKGDRNLIHAHFPIYSWFKQLILSVNVDTFHDSIVWKAIWNCNFGDDIWDFVQKVKGNRFASQTAFFCYRSKFRWYSNLIPCPSSLTSLKSKNPSQFPYLRSGEGGTGVFTRSNSSRTLGGDTLFTRLAPLNSLSSTPLNSSHLTSSSKVGVLELWKMSSRASATLGALSSSSWRWAGLGGPGSS